jgi:hypothetical protein
LKLNWAPGGGAIFAEIVPQDGGTPFRLIDGEQFSDRLSFGPEEGRVYITPQVRSGGHFLLYTWFEGSGKIRAQVDVKRVGDDNWKAIRLIGIDNSGRENANVQRLWVGHSD